ncbi:serine/threonine-protein kinase [Nannocystaceae bacterium ST9]
MTLSEQNSASRIEGVLRNLADTSEESGVVEDIVAARLFGEMQQAPKLARFTLLELVGSGGMGRVYAAYDPKLDRKVAIKVVRSLAGPAEQPASARARLVREARVLARLNHPNVVAIHETGVHAEQVYVVMEFVEGGSLGEWAKDQTRSWSEIVAMYVQAGEGLVAAHAIGVVHRDFKPANVLVGIDGRARVVDFGLARVVDARALAKLGPRTGDTIDDSITTTGHVCGTPGYLAPELLTGGKASPQTDLYAFCVSLLDALGPAPTDEPGKLPGVPAPIIDALLRGIAPDPAVRWSSLDEVLGLLRREAGISSSAPRARLGRRGALLGIAGSTGIAAILVAFDRAGMIELGVGGVVMLELLLVAIAIVAIVGALARPRATER